MTAWVELHAWLASAARAHSETGDPEMDAAARAYATALADDDRDDLLGRTTHALEACDDERCARAAVLGTSFAVPYLDALPGFLERHWMDRAATARDAVEAAREAMAPEVEALVTALARDLAIDGSAAVGRLRGRSAGAGTRRADPRAPGRSRELLHEATWRKR
jgi:hypothetical protein